MYDLSRVVIDYRYISALRALEEMCYAFGVDSVRNALDEIEAKLKLDNSQQMDLTDIYACQN